MAIRLHGTLPITGCQPHLPPYPLLSPVDPNRANTVGHTSWAAPMKYVMLENAQAGRSWDAAAQTLTLCVGDEMMWMWNGLMNNVVKVSSAAYSACKTAKGTTIVKRSDYSGKYIKFMSPGTRYYTSSIKGRCAQGQKIKVVVNKC